jgi:hypothetical protein
MFFFFGAAVADWFAAFVADFVSGYGFAAEFAWFFDDF